MDFKFPSIDKYIREDDIVIEGNEESKEYVNIPQLMGQQGLSVLQTLKMRAPILHKMVGCIIQSRKSSSSITKNPNLNKTIISENELKDLEIYIKTLEIDMIGYAKVPSELVFKNHKILYGNAIVIIMEMKSSEMETAPSKKALKEVFRTYSDLGLTVNKIADYLRKKGFNAMAGPAIGGDASYVPIAEQAGLGVIGKHGLLITDKSFGPSMRIATIYTDIENLPMQEENPHLWIKDFCNKCKKCVRGCPGKAIYEETLESGRAIDQNKCALPFARDYGCSLCIKNCTFFNKDYYEIKEKFIK